MATEAALDVKISASVDGLARGVAQAQGALNRLDRTAQQSAGVDRMAERATASLARLGNTATTTGAKVAAASTASASGLNTVRGAMTSLAGAALQTAPGVAPLVGILGSLALGSGVMIGVMAGMTALAYAWDRITRSARENKKATEEALDALRKAGAGEVLGPAGETPAQLVAAYHELDRLTEERRKKQNEIDEEIARAADRPNRSTPLANALVGLEEGAAKIDTEIRAVEQAIAHGKAAIAAIDQAANDQRLAEQERAAREREAAAARAQAKEREAFARHLARMRAVEEKMGIARQKAAANAERLRGNLPSGFFSPTVNVPQAPYGAMAAPGGVAVGARNRGRGRTRMDDARAMGGDALRGLAGGAMAVLNAFNPLALLSSTLGSALAPIGNLMARLGSILARALLPILEALWPVFKLVVVAATYVGQILFKLAAVILDISGAIWRAIGSLVKGVGELLNKLPGSLGAPLVKAGNAMLGAADAMGGVADGFREGADELGKAREEIQGLSWEEATAPLAQAAREAAHNVSEYFDANRRRFQVTGGGLVTRSAAGTGPQVQAVTTFAPGAIVLQAAPGEDPVTFGRRMLDAIRYLRGQGGTTELDLAILGVG